MSEQVPEAAPQDEAPAVVVQAGLAGASGAVPEHPGNPEDSED
jgi:hypothetical protein